jgi:hypothetical protein
VRLTLFVSLLGICLPFVPRLGLVLRLGSILVPMLGRPWLFRLRHPPRVIWLKSTRWTRSLTNNNVVKGE